MENLKVVAKIAVAAAGGVIVGDMVASRIEKTSYATKAKPEHLRAARIGIQAGTAAVVFGVLNAVL